MVSKKNFQQNGIRPTMQPQRQMPYKKPLFKPPIINNFNQMFNTSQIPDNPGYMDFNLPTPPINGGIAGNSGLHQNGNGGGGGCGGGGAGAGANGAPQNKKKNNKNKQKSKQQSPQAHHPQQLEAQPNGNWNKKTLHHPNGIGSASGRFNVGCLPQRNFQRQPMMGGPLGGRRGRMMPPMVGHGVRGNGLGPVCPPIPPPPHGFQPPIIPPMPPMGRGGPPMPPPMGVQPPPFMRRANGPLPPPPMPPMMPPRGMPHGIPPMPFAGGGGGVGKIKKPKIIKKVTKGKSSIKTLKNLVNQYPIDKPWVTEEIRAEYEKKVDIENRLKGNKDDELFAQFKVQRDKFVAMYEAARDDYLKKEAAAVKAKDARNKETINKTATKDDNKEAIPNESNNSN